MFTSGQDLADAMQFSSGRFFFLFFFNAAYMLPAALARLQKADAQYLVSFRTLFTVWHCLSGKLS